MAERLTSHTFRVDHDHVPAAVAEVRNGFDEIPNNGLYILGVQWEYDFSHYYDVFSYPKIIRHTKVLQFAGLREHRYGDEPDDDSSTMFYKAFPSVKAITERQKKLGLEPSVDCYRVQLSPYPEHIPLKPYCDYSKNRIYPQGIGYVGRTSSRAHRIFSHDRTLSDHVGGAAFLATTEVMDASSEWVDGLGPQPSNRDLRFAGRFIDNVSANLFSTSSGPVCIDERYPHQRDVRPFKLPSTYRADVSKHTLSLYEAFVKKYEPVCAESVKARVEYLLGKIANEQARSVVVV